MSVDLFVLDKLSYLWCAECTQLELKDAWGTLLIQQSYINKTTTKIFSLSSNSWMCFLNRLWTVWLWRILEPAGIWTFFFPDISPLSHWSVLPKPTAPFLFPCLTRGRPRSRASLHFWHHSRWFPTVMDDRRGPVWQICDQNKRQ